MSEMKININKVPSEVICVLELIESEGYKSYLVGGSVRDILLNKEPHDWDVCTNAPLEVLQTLWSNCKVVGAAFGVVLVKVDDLEIQIAKFRMEQGYSDYRHPDSIYFTDNIMEDLQRRDFTINTFSMDSKGNLIYVDGALDDLNNRIIRAVGDPIERFNEDALRMLRAIRFSCQLGFSIDEITTKVIMECWKLIINISEERIQEELNKILLSDRPDDGIYQLRYHNLLRFIIPEMVNTYHCVQNGHHKYTVFGHITETLKNSPKNLVLRLAALLHDIGKPATKVTDEKGLIHFYGHEEVSMSMAQDILEELRYDNKTIDEVIYLVFHHMEMFDFPTTDKGIRKLLNRHGEDRLKKLIEIHRADLLGSGTRDQNEVEQLIQIYKDKLEEVLQEKPPIQLVDLAIDGNDIMQITTYGPGKRIGEIKNELMNIVLEHPELNTKEDLMRIVFCDY